MAVTFSTQSSRRFKDSFVHQELFRDFLAVNAVETDEVETDSSNWIGFAQRHALNCLMQCFIRILQNIPKQDNGYDCGAFICQLAERISHGAPIDFLQDDMEGMRKKMVSEILGGELSGNVVIGFCAMLFLKLKL
uniref:Ubiquitin-like protease family profile domain-containing protein n=1 Tax=Ditylenchus dipsaci TaxID=166011 RepID=A0A915D6N8_9BILA